MPTSDFLVTVEWKPGCACGVGVEPRAVMVEGSQVGTSTGVRFQVDYHVKACTNCGAPSRLAIVSPHPSPSIGDSVENARYPNHCIAPSVMQIDTAEVEWSDGHPLNHGDTTAEEFDRLFPRQGL